MSPCCLDWLAGDQHVAQQQQQAPRSGHGHPLSIGGEVLPQEAFELHPRKQLVQQRQRAEGPCAQGLTTRLRAGAAMRRRRNGRAGRLAFHAPICSESQPGWECPVDPQNTSFRTCDESP